MSQKKKHEEEEGGESVGLWYVSFADMITLLLSFFVMLTTFSSYSKEDLTKFAGVWAQLSDYSVFSSVRSNEGLAPSSQRPVDFTQAGSEKPTESDPRVVQNTGESQWTAMADAYNRRRVLQIPASRLFWGSGTQCTLLTAAGKAHLKMLSAFLRQVPCQVLIGNSIASGILPSCKGQELDRSYALLAHLRNEEHIAPGRIGLKASGPELADSSGLEGVMEITLLAEGSK